MSPKHFLDIDALDRKSLRAIIDLAAAIKRKGRAPKSLKLTPGAVLAMIFEKPSTRTRVSFEVAMHQLGGTARSCSIRRTCSSAAARRSPTPRARCRAMSMRSCCAPGRTRR